MAVLIQGCAPLLQVFDMSRSLRFYRDILGFELVSSAGQGDQPDWVLLRHQKTELMLNTAYESPNRPSAPDPERLAAHEDTSLYFACPDIEGAYRHLREQGIDLKEPSTAPYGMRQLYVKDPDGYLLCFQWPATDQTHALWREWYGY